METKRYNANSTLGRPMNGPQKMVNLGRKATKSAPKKARGAKATGARRPRPRLDPLSCEFVPPVDDELADAAGEGTDSETDSYPGTDPDADPEVAEILREMSDLEEAADADAEQLEAALRSKTTRVGVPPGSIHVEMIGRSADRRALHLPEGFWSIVIDADLCASVTNSVVLYSPGITSGPGAFEARDLAELDGNELELTMIVNDRGEIRRRRFSYRFGPVKAVHVLGHYYSDVLGQVVVLPVH